MKVAIITFHRALNYGAVLQAYALQEAIINMGNSCTILDYSCPTMEEYTSVFNMFEKERTLKNYIVTSIKSPFRFIRKKRFQAFCKRYLICSKTSENLSEECGRYDCFITGSDQVWNDYLTGNDSTYFLDFVNSKNKKNSYAACFGYEVLPEKLKDKYRYYLDTFKNISVRDETSKKILEELYGEGKDICTVVDPTLLWTEDFWKKFRKENHRGKYILIYSLNKEIGLMKCAKKLSEKYNIHILYICNDVFELKKYTYVKPIFSPRPEEFVSLIANAEYVITNSFHGTVFSLIFHRKFYCETQYGDRINKRIEDLLEQVGCKNRILTCAGEIEENKIIQWDVVDEKIINMRNESLNYLKKI